MKSPVVRSGHMLVTSLGYYFFLTLVFFAFWMCRTQRVTSLGLICAANLFFYGRWGVAYLVLIPAASVIDYFLARGSRPAVIRHPPHGGGASIMLNLGLIAVAQVPAWFGVDGEQSGSAAELVFLRVSGS